jgi:hypothetical protein
VYVVTLASSGNRVLSALQSNPDQRASAAGLRVHPYLTLPKDWKFSGFVRARDIGADLEEGRPQVIDSTFMILRQRDVTVTV